MALDKASMAAKVKASISAVPPQQFDTATSPDAYRDQIIEALCAGIIEEITTNADVVISAGSSAGSYKVS